MHCVRKARSALAAIAVLGLLNTAPAVVGGSGASAHVPNTSPPTLTLYIPNSAVTTGVYSILTKDSGWRGVWISGTLRSFGLDPQPPAVLTFEACTRLKGCFSEPVASIVDGQFAVGEERFQNFTVDRHFGPGKDLLSARLILTKRAAMAQFPIYPG
jgi:hypothetical protein